MDDWKHISVSVKLPISDEDARSLAAIYDEKLGRYYRGILAELERTMDEMG